LGSYDLRWDSWLLPRVDGQFSGTTDEIIQWAACKWGLPDNYLRAEADTESTWFQYENYPSGRCVTYYGCGDWFSSEPYAARKTYCDGLATAGGHDYQSDYGDGYCPKTFSIVGIMSWWNPSWGFTWAGNHERHLPVYPELHGDGTRLHGLTDPWLLRGLAVGAGQQLHVGGSVGLRRRLVLRWLA